MTLEARFTLEPKDISGIEIECRNCRIRISYRSDFQKPFESHCPACKQQLFDLAEGNWAAVRDLHSALQQVVERKIPNVRLCVPSELVRNYSNASTKTQTNT